MAEGITGYKSNRTGCANCKEHNYAMNLTLKLVVARNKYFITVTEAERHLFLFDIYERLKELIDLYPKHIKKEDKKDL